MLRQLWRNNSDMREIIVGKNDAGQRIDKFLTKKYPSMPFSLMYKLIRKKQITVNRKRITEKAILSENDRILIFAPEDVFSPKSREDFFGLKKEFDIVYEDDNILIVNKPSGLLVHSDDSDTRNTLINQIKSYLYKNGAYDPDTENSFAPSLCNRIDRNTSGLVIAAKSAASLRDMNEIIKEREIKKIYLAAVHGTMEKKQDEITLFLEKDQRSNTVYVVSAKTNNSKTAITRFKTVAENRQKELSLLEIELVTGRTHQIRVTFAHLGHPLLGDGKYAKNKLDREQGFDSQALCAYKLTFCGCKKREVLGYLEGKTFFAEKPLFLNLFE